MIMIRAIIRPEKVGMVLSELVDAGFPAVTKIDVVGRGKQRGLKVGDIQYDEIPKEMLMIAAANEDKEDVIKIIMRASKTGNKGSFGDGKIFVSSIDEVYTISSGTEGL